MTARQIGSSTFALMALVLALASCDADTSADEAIVIVAGQPLEGYGRYSVEESGGFGFREEDIHTPGPTIRVTADEPITITFKNEHYRRDAPFTEPHNFAVLADSEEFIPEPLWGSKTVDIKPDESDTVSFTPDIPGTYYYVCTIGDHRRRGMLGKFIVEPS